MMYVAPAVASIQPSFAPRPILPSPGACGRGSGSGSGGLLLFVRHGPGLEPGLGLGLGLLSLVISLNNGRLHGKGLALGRGGSLWGRLLDLLDPLLGGRGRLNDDAGEREGLRRGAKQREEGYERSERGKGG